MSDTDSNKSGPYCDAENSSAAGPALSALAPPLPAERLFRFGECVVEVLSSEWLLTCVQRSNGGTTIALRSLFTSIILYLLSLGLRNLVDPSRTWHPSPHQFQVEVGATLPWLGTIFAATYAALYARFSSQWTYLANLYNQIKAAECRNDRNDEVLAEWKAGFIEDAIELHLAYKPLFASVIRAWGGNPQVANAFSETCSGGKLRFDVTMERVEAQWHRSNARAEKSQS